MPLKTILYPKTRVFQCYRVVIGEEFVVDEQRWQDHELRLIINMSNTELVLSHHILTIGDNIEQINKNGVRETNTVNNI